MAGRIELFGLIGFTHGAARVLTVMSPAGATAAIAAIGRPADVIRYGGKGTLPRYHEQRSGALQRLIEEYGIVLLSKPEWDTRKAELGENIFI